MIEAKHCTVQANFDSGSFQNFGITAPLHNHQYQNSIQSEYNLSFKDFQVLEIMIAEVVNKYLKEFNKK